MSEEDLPDTDLEQVRDEDEQIHLQLRMVQEESDNKSEGAVHVNHLTQLWRFVDEDEGRAINGTAFGSFEALPEALKSQISEKEKDWLEKGGNVYLTAPVQEVAEHNDYVDRVEHRFRKKDELSAYNYNEEALEEDAEEGKPEEEERSGEEMSE